MDGSMLSRDRMLVVALVCIILVNVIQEADCSWLFGSSASSINDEVDSTKELVTPVINREIRTSVVAHEWPSSPQNILCEAYAYHFPIESNDGTKHEHTSSSHKDSRSSSSSKANSYLLHLLDLVEKYDTPPLSTYDEAIDFALQAAMFESKQQHSLLRLSLALRANSPLCELHRGLARDIVKEQQQEQEQQQQQGMSNRKNIDSVLVLYPQNIVVTGSDMEGIASPLKAVLTTPGLETVDSTKIPDWLLPGESVIRSRTSNSHHSVDSVTNTSQFAVLYTNFGTNAFVQSYRFLEQQPNLPFVVRFLGDVFFEDQEITMGDTGSITATTSSSPLILQGYGVRLDVRNVEYKVFDDRSESGKYSDDSNNGLLNLTLAFTKEQEKINTTVTSRIPLVSPANEFLGGVKLSAILRDESVEKVADIEQTLWKIHDSQQVHSQIIPPVWQRRRLALQATSAIVSSPDQLATLQEIAQNLPSVASTLVHMKVPPQIQQAGKAIEDFIEKSSTNNFRSGILYLNGRPINFDRPSFNMFEFLNVLRQEQHYIESLKTTIGPFLLAEDGKPSFEALRGVFNAWTMGSSFLSNSDNNQDQHKGMMNEDDEQESPTPYRIDVGRGWKHAVMYLNDVEKDINYLRWTKSLYQALMNMQFGMPPSVRRNLFTVLASFDPLVNRNNNGYTFANQLIKGMYPARLGIIIFSEEDLNQCAKYISENDVKDDAPCPVPLRIVKKGTTLDDLKQIPATTHAIHRLISHCVQESSGFPGSSSSYVDFLFQALDKVTEGFFSLYDLAMVHAQMMTAIHRWANEEGAKEALEVLAQKELTPLPNDAVSTYGGTLRFALEKGLKPGMSFLNGRPLPLDEADEINVIFGEEQQHVFGLIMHGVITDDRPKSVYAHLLTGEKVLKRNHPLLSPDSDSSYVQPVQRMDSSLFPFLVPSHESFTAAASFVIDAYVTLDNREGLNIASTLLSTLDNFPSTIEDSSSKPSGKTNLGFTYRILPRTSAAAADPICSLFAHASMLGTNPAISLKAIVDEYNKLRSNDPTTDNFELLKLALKGLDKNLREKIVDRKTACEDVTFPTTQKSNVIIANGRLFAPDGARVSRSDIELLLTLELKRAKAVTKLLNSHLSFQQPSAMVAVSQVAAFLADSESSTNLNRVYMKGVIEQFDHQSDMKENPLHLVWNVDSTVADDIKLEATILLDPITESAQRVSPILRFLRDDLRVPLHLILAPPTEVDKESKIPITSYYRLVVDPKATPDSVPPQALFSYLPTNHVLTIVVDVPEPWNIQQSASVQDTDNLVCNIRKGCNDEVNVKESINISTPPHQQNHVTKVEFGLKNLLFFGQCYETNGSPPNGLQLTLTKRTDMKHQPSKSQEVEIAVDGSVVVNNNVNDANLFTPIYSETLVMKNIGYWQLRANPGVWLLSIAEKSKGSEIFQMVEGSVTGGMIQENKVSTTDTSTKTLYMKDFVNHGELLLMKRRPGFETSSLFHTDEEKSIGDSSNEVINVFSLATGHLYERFLKIMMLSVTKRTSSKVKFWLFENYLSPTFKSSAKAMAERIGCEVEYVTYKWPHWLRGQTEKQRIIWGYKILFLDVLFPLNVKKIIYVDADQVIRGDLKELWDMDLHGAPYGYTPFCTSRESTLGYQFWRDGFWKSHLRGKPYHISALYVVDLDRFRRTLVGDQLRSIYQQLSHDPNSLSNLDQDLPNYAQHQVPIFSLPQEWLWCESWCSDDTKSTAKTIDLCNNPEHKEPKVSMAKRIISGNLFNESWVELDAEVERYEKDYLANLATIDSTKSFRALN